MIIVAMNFKKCKEREKYPYDADFLHYLERLVADLDRKIRRGHERLDHQDEMPTVPMSKENKDKLEVFTEKIKKSLQEVEKLGEEGLIEEAEGAMKRVESLKTEKEQLIIASGGDVRGGNTQEKRMKVCDICGAFLVIGDTEKRTMSHLEGKQHQGYYRIRQAIEDYKKRDIVRDQTRDIDNDGDNKDRDIRRDRRRDSDSKYHDRPRDNHNRDKDRRRSDSDRERGDRRRSDSDADRYKRRPENYGDNERKRTKENNQF